MQTAILGGFQERYEFLLEHVVVLIHRELDIAADETADGFQPQEHCGIHAADHEVVLLLAVGVVIGQHVVEVGEVSHAHPRFLHGGQHAIGALAIEGLAKVEVVGDRIEHGFGRYIAFGRMQGGGELDVIHFQLACELQPIFDGLIRIRIADFPGREFLEGGGEYAHLHEFRFEGFHGHGKSFPAFFLARAAEIYRLMAQNGSSEGKIGLVALHRPPRGFYTDTRANFTPTSGVLRGFTICVPQVGSDSQPNG